MDLWQSANGKKGGCAVRGEEEVFEPARKIEKEREMEREAKVEVSRQLTINH